MKYRMVIGQPLNKDFPVARFWYEAARETAPRWMPWPITGWYRRWRQISPKQKLHLRNPQMAGAVVEFSCEAEMCAMQTQLERAEAAWT